MGARLDADRLQPDPLDPRPPSGRHEEMVTAQLPSILQPHDEVFAVPRSRGRLHSEHQLDPVPAQRLTQPFAERRRLPREHALGGFDECHLSTEAARGLRSSTPAGPPPSTSSRLGTAFIPVASFVPQTPSSSRRPGTGGTNGSAPLARTTCSAV